VYAFEPVPVVLSLVRRSVELNDVVRVEVVLAPVGDERREEEFFYADLGVVPTSSGLSRELMERWNLPLETTKVPVVTLDDFVGEHGLETVDLVKLDTESTERAVLRGGRGVLKRFRPSVVMEAPPGWVDLDALRGLFDDPGYRAFVLCSDGPVEKRRLEPDWASAHDFEHALRIYLFTPLSADGVRRSWDNGAP
jgi:FkbM family methyltransferase